MKARFNTAAASLTSKASKVQRRKAKNWIHVNIGESEAKEIRALAECQGIEYRGFLEQAVRSYVREHAAQIEREFGVKAWEITKIGKARRRAVGEARREMIRACQKCGVGFPERN